MHHALHTDIIIISLGAGATYKKFHLLKISCIIIIVQYNSEVVAIYHENNRVKS